MTESEHAALLSCGLFANIENCDTLLQCLHGVYAQYERNEILWNIGDEVHSCAVILSGSVRAESVNASGQHSLMAIHRAGSLVGDVLMATPGAVSPVYVIASEPVSVYYIRYAWIIGGCSKCCKVHLQLRENLLAEIARKFWQQRRRMRYFTTTSLRARISRFLLDQSAEAGSEEFSLQGTREDFADYLCVNRSALSRELSRMRQAGMVDYRRNSFRILNPVRLAEIADCQSS